MKMFSFENSRLLQAQKKATMLTHIQDQKNNGNKRCFVIFTGGEKQMFFYPVNNSENYIQSLKKSNTLPCKDFDLTEMIDFYKKSYPNYN